ncbi:hypothetical protein EON81_00840 [bacterium]|nr:MAG: hypothetical protein EON81_00840 [bacterium]
MARGSIGRPPRASRLLRFQAETMHGMTARKNKGASSPDRGGFSLPMRAAFALTAVFIAVGAARAQTPSSVSGLRAWVDASQSAGQTGDRVTTLTPGAGPVMTGIGPILNRAGVGGAASMRFSGTELLRSVGNVTSGSSFTSVVAFRPSSVGRRMNLFQIGQTSPMGVRLGTDRKLELFFGSRTAKGNQTWTAGDTGVVSLIWSGSIAKLYVNGTLDTTLAAGAGTSVDGTLLIGARAVGQDGFRGDLVGLAHYARALSDFQRETVEKYYAASTAVPLKASYVSTAASTGGSGLLPSTPFSELSAAVIARATDGGQILVDAPADRPLVGMVEIISEAPLTIRSLNGTKWFMKAGRTVTEGWTRDLDGAYSQVWAPAGFLAGYVPTLLDSKGRPTLLAPPYAGEALAPGEMELVNGRLRIRLVGNVNPNLHTVEISRQSSCLRIHNGLGDLVIRDGVFRGGSQSCVQVGQPDRGGRLTAIDCIAEYGVCGFRGAGELSILVLQDCVARLNSNDGFSMKGYTGVKSTMRLTGCIGYENWEEGASPHNDTIIYANDCSFHDNGESGMMAINRSRFEATNTTFVHNHLRRTEPLEGGAAYWEESKGSLTNCTFRNNMGAGYYRSTVKNIVISGALSEGNAFRDR